MSLSRHALCALTTLLSLQLIACGPTKGYSGPELPPEQISQLRFKAGDSVGIATRIVDGKKVSARGVDVLPDVHTIELHATVSGEPQQCRIQAEFNQSGYESCTKKNGYCNCHDYMTVYRACSVPFWESVCGIKLSTDPGVAYLTSVFMQQDRVRIATEHSGHPNDLRFGQCTVGAQQWQQKRIYEGTGVANTYKYGITNCGNYY